MTLDDMLDLADRYLGPLGAWIVQAAAWAFAGMNPITVLGAIAALWWTVERALHEREKRRLAALKTADYADYVQDNRGVLRKLADQMRTKPGDLQ